LLKAFFDISYAKEENKLIPQFSLPIQELRCIIHFFSDLLQLRTDEEGTPEQRIRTMMNCDAFHASITVHG
jgi:hypothetical protein